MSGDASNASVWTDADVYIAPLETSLPADGDTEFGAGWELVGLLDGDAGFTQTRSEDKSDMYAWGGILVRTTRRNFKLEIGFTVLEDNDVTRDLIWPGSSTGSLVVPRPEQVLIAFEMTEGDVTRRLITANYAEVDVSGDITDNESDLTRYELMATIYPDTSTSPATLLTEQTGTGGGS